MEFTVEFVPLKSAIHKVSNFVQQIDAEIEQLEKTSREMWAFVSTKLSKKEQADTYRHCR